MAKNKCGACREMPQRYNKRLTVERPLKTSAVTDDSGQIDLEDDDNWEVVGTIKGRFITKGGDEARVYKQVLATTDTVIMTPKTTLSMTITTDPTHRLKMGTRIFNVTTAYRIDESGREVQIEATERRQA